MAELNKVGRGRPAWQPTDEQRANIKAMASYGIPHPEIARVHGISERTLERHCAEELATGKTVANTKVGEFLYSAIMGDSVKSDHARITAAIFWAKTSMGWKETTVVEHKDGDAEEQSLRDSIDSKFDRVAVTGTANGFSAEPEWARARVTREDRNSS